MDRSSIIGLLFRLYRPCKCKAKSLGIYSRTHHGTAERHSVWDPAVGYKEPFMTFYVLYMRSCGVDIIKSMPSI